MPIAAGGAVRNLDQARALLRSGADKIVINTALFIWPDLVVDLAREFGRQCIVASVDLKKNADSSHSIWVGNAALNNGLSTAENLARVAELPIGELYLNSVDRDGTGQGFELDLLTVVPPEMRSVPIILAGGAGNYRHLLEGISLPEVDAVATAHLHNFIGDGLERAREELLKANVNLAQWSSRA